MDARTIFDILIKLFLRFDMEKLKKLRFQKITLDFFKEYSGTFFWNVMIVIALLKNPIQHLPIMCVKVTNLN